MNVPPAAAVVLALDFGGTKTALTVADRHGTRLHDLTVETAAEHGARASLKRAVGAARTLLDGREPLAVGVSTIGIPGAEGVALAPNIPGWEELALGHELALEFPKSELRLATDVKAAARYEHDAGALKGCDPGLYINLGTGLAVAIVAGGTVVAGRHGASGEIGYNLRTVADVGRRSGDRIPLEDVVSGKALSLAARANGSAELACHVVEFIDELAFHLVNLAIAVDPQRIVVGGGMVRSWASLHAPLRTALDAAVPYPPQLVPAAHPYDAPLLGALALAVEAVRTGT
ncbi:ROK family protein [Streptomyces sp. NBC_01446]|uniref:ROK family protein n=1 Tax=unclassified Streptomyces TaxID=2593676 RepID=UPI0022566C6E|nr:ROK family protein [Streptomyces sp. NBC_01446]MCX4646498.1 ROK family protein [Streptomyces sp. NBC_01446]